MINAKQANELTNKFEPIQDYEIILNNFESEIGRAARKGEREVNYSQKYIKKYFGHEAFDRAVSVLKSRKFLIKEITVPEDDGYTDSLAASIRNICSGLTIKW